MKIRAVETRVESFRLARPYTIAFRTIDAIDIGVVALKTDRGLVGLGTASPEPHVTGETEAACRDALAAPNVEWLVGRDVRSLPALSRELESRAAATPAARAAIDAALHDLLAKLLGVPLVEMLGREHDALPTSITIGIKSVAETLTEAEEYVGRGFKILKVKLGRSLDEDLERLGKLRERFARGIGIRVDPNQGYSREQTLRFFEETRSLDLELVEQPMAAKDVEGLRSLPEELRRRIAADESLLTERDALSLVAPPRACGIFNIKLMKCGGIAPARGIARIADLAGVELMWGCMDESRVSIAAALHAALASPATRYLDLDGHLDLGRDLVDGGFVLEDGRMRPTGEPGLGVRERGRD